MIKNYKFKIKSMPYLVQLENGLVVEYKKSDIRKAISEAGKRTDLPPELVDEISEKITDDVTRFIIKKGGTVKEEELKDKILVFLDIFSPELSEAWRKYERRSRKKLLY